MKITITAEQLIKALEEQCHCGKGHSGYPSIITLEIDEQVEKEEYRYDHGENGTCGNCMKRYCTCPERQLNGGWIPITPELPDIIPDIPENKIYIAGEMKKNRKAINQIVEYLKHQEK